MNALARVAHTLLDLVAPLTCAACAESPPTWPRGTAATLCVTCSIGVIPAEDPPENVTVPYAHGGPLGRAVHRAKYGESPHVARRLGRLLVHAGVFAREGVDVIVPVPLHRRRLARRGFNQAVEMARSLGRPMILDAIDRVRDTPSQVGLGRSARVANVRGAFALRRDAQIRGARVLVLDDVVTTGATIAEVVAAIRGAAPREVTAVALTRASLDP